MALRGALQREYSNFHLGASSIDCCSPRART